MNKPLLLGLGIGAIAVGLAACGGGGGGGGSFTPPGPGTSSTPTPAPTASGSTTTASGILVDDANGSPLGGVRVVLMPWAPCGATPAPTSITPENDGCPTPLPSPQVTTAPNGAFSLGGVPNGHYVLVVGDDVASTPPPGYAPPTCTNNCPTPTPAPFTVRATVHDNVTLTGGSQTLHAPTLPPVPTITPPAWETNGDYRLATLDATTEMPCLIAWQYERAQHSLALSAVDEWLVENVRASVAAHRNGGLTTGNSFISGGTSCDSWIVATFSVPAAAEYDADPRTLWFAGQYMYSAAIGIAEFPIDPRSFTDPNVPTWP